MRASRLRPNQCSPTRANRSGSKTVFGSDLFLIVAIHQLATGQGELWRCLIVGDPIVHINGGFVPMALWTDQNGAEKTGWLRFAEFIQSRGGAPNANSDHTVGYYSSAFRRADRAQDRLVIEPEGDPFVIFRIFGNRDIGGIKGIFCIRFGLGSVDNVLFRKTRSQQSIGRSVGPIMGGRK